MSVERSCYTVEETAALLGLSRNSAYEAVKKRDIPSVKIGRRILVPKIALAEFLAGEQTADRRGGRGQAA